MSIRDVEDQPLAHLALGGAHADVGVERQAGDLDRDACPHPLVVVGLLVVAVVTPLRRGLARRPRRGPLTADRSSRDGEGVADRADVVDSEHAGAAFQGEDVRRDRRSQAVAVRAGRSAWRGTTCGRFRATIGRPSVQSSSRRRSSSRLWATVLPKPIPGSSNDPVARERPRAQPQYELAPRGTRERRRRRRRNAGRAASSGGCLACASGSRRRRGRRRARPSRGRRGRRLTSLT